MGARPRAWPRQSETARWADTEARFKSERPPWLAASRILAPRHITEFRLNQGVLPWLKDKPRNWHAKGSG